MKSLQSKLITSTIATLVILIICSCAMLMISNLMTVNGTVNSTYPNLANAAADKVVADVTVYKSQMEMIAQNETIINDIVF